MSTQANTYVMFGCLLGYNELKKKHAGADDLYSKIEDYTDNAFKPEVNPKDGLTVLYDGANGKYVAIGHVIAKTENWQGFRDPITLPSPDAYEEHADAVADLLIELGVDPLEHDCKFLVISHYR